MSLDYSSTKHTPANDQKILAMNGSTAGYIDTDEFRDNYILASKGQANGLASLDSNGKLVTSQLPDMADDVLSYANYAAFPVTGYDGILYIAKDTNKIYRWNGSAYVELTVDISGKADTSYVNAQLALKANAATTYTKAEVDTALGSKADSSTTYTKTEVDSAISPKADTSTVNTLKADLTEQQYAIDNLLAMTEGRTHNTYTQTTENGTKTLTSSAEVAPYAEVNKVLGKSLCWNQLFADDITTGWTVSNGTSSASEGVLHVSATGGRLQISKPRVYNALSDSHIYYMLVEAKASASVSIRISFSSSTTSSTFTIGTSYTSIDELLACSSNTTLDFCFDSYPSSLESGLTIDIKKIKMFDLTSMLGVTSVDSVTDSMKAFVKAYASAHPQYNAGSILNLKGAITIKSKGRNLIDKTSYSDWWVSKTGGITPSSSRRAFYVDVEPNTQYVFKAYDNVTYYTICQYNGESFISGVENPYTSFPYLAFTTEANVNKVSVSLYNNIDCDVQLEKGSTATEYSAYGVKDTLQLKDSIIAQLRSAGTVRDTFVLHADGTSTLTQNIKVIDLGSLTWGYYPQSFGGIFKTISITDAMAHSYTSLDNQTNDCGYVSCGKIAESTDDKSITINSNYHSANSTFVKDSRYTDAETFKSALNGKMLYYELATPVVTNYTEAQTTDILNNGNRFLKVEKGGTISVSSNESYGDAQITYQTQITNA